MPNRRDKGRQDQGQSQRGASMRSALLGIALVARGRRDGFQQFGNTPEAFLASLAPLIAFPLVNAGLLLLDGQGWGAAEGFLQALCAVLAPPVLSQALAQAWGRDAAWLRYATAFNWCQWAVPAMAAALLLVLGVLLDAGLPQDIAEIAFLASLAAYAFWLHWFVTRHGLGLGRWRAALLVVLVNAGTALLAFGPELISRQ